MWLVKGCGFGCSSRSALVYIRPQMMGSNILSSAHACSVLSVLLQPYAARSGTACIDWIHIYMILVCGQYVQQQRCGGSSEARCTFVAGLSPGTVHDMLPAFACCRFFSPYGFTLKPSPRNKGCRFPCPSNSGCPLPCCMSGSCNSPMLAPRMAVAHPSVAMKPRRAARHFPMLPSVCWLSLRARWLSPARNCSEVRGTAHDSANPWWNAALL